MMLFFVWPCSALLWGTESNELFSCLCSQLQHFHQPIGYRDLLNLPNGYNLFRCCFSSSSRIWGMGAAGLGGFVKYPINLTWLDNGFLFVAKPWVSVLFCTIWPGLSQLNLEGELKLYAVESSVFFFELIIDLGTQPFEKCLWVSTEGLLFRYIHLPAPQKVSNRKWSLSEG